LSHNDREDDHGEKAEEVEDEGEEGKAGRSGAQEEESSKEERGQETGREEESQEAVSAAEGEGASTRGRTDAFNGADARDGSALYGPWQRRRLSRRRAIATINRSPRSRRAVFL
jgi:hypothetical protein